MLSLRMPLNRTFFEGKYTSLHVVSGWTEPRNRDWWFVQCTYLAKIVRLNNWLNFCPTMHTLLNKVTGRNMRDHSKHNSKIWITLCFCAIDEDHRNSTSRDNFMTRAPGWAIMSFLLHDYRLANLHINVVYKKYLATQWNPSYIIIDVNLEGRFGFMDIFNCDPLLKRFALWCLHDYRSRNSRWDGW